MVYFTIIQLSKFCLNYFHAHAEHGGIAEDLIFLKGDFLTVGKNFWSNRHVLDSDSCMLWPVKGCYELLHSQLNVVYLVKWVAFGTVAHHSRTDHHYQTLRQIKYNLAIEYSTTNVHVCINICIIINITTIIILCIYFW